MSPVADHAVSTQHLQADATTAIQPAIAQEAETSRSLVDTGRDGEDDDTLDGDINAADDNSDAGNDNDKDNDNESVRSNSVVGEGAECITLSADMEFMKSSVCQSDLFTTRLFEEVENPELRAHLERERREQLLGVRSIATAAFSRDRDRKLASNAQLVTVEGAHFATTCAELHMHMSVADRVKFNWVLRTIQQVNSAEWSTIMGPAEIPDSITEANRVFMTGNHSISTKQPVPMLSIVENRIDEGKVEEMVIAEPKDILQFFFH